MLPMLSGIFPVRRFPGKFNEISPMRVPSSSGISPVRLLIERSMLLLKSCYEQDPSSEDVKEHNFFQGYGHPSYLIGVSEPQDLRACHPSMSVHFQ
ncbi:hypothetical protein V6N13_090723 [Hibiscus sabdariffa]